jgi:multidrug efflux system outer membrane protein
MPILNASSFEQVKAAKGGYYVAYYNYMQTVKSAFADVDNSLTNQDKVNQQYLAGQKSQAASWHYYQLVLAQYQIGTGNKISMLNAKLVTDSALLNLNQLKMQQLASIVQVYQSLAGGYNVTESATSLD